MTNIINKNLKDFQSGKITATNSNITPTNIQHNPPLNTITSTPRNQFVNNLNNGFSKVAGPFDPRTGLNKIDVQRQAFIDASKRFQDSLVQSQAEKEARQKLLDFQTNTKLGVAGLEGQGRGIPLGIIRGQQAKLGKQAQIKAQGLQGDISLAQQASQGNQRQAQAGLNLQKFLLNDLEKSSKDRATQLAKENRPLTISELGKLNLPFGSTVKDAVGIIPQALKTPRAVKAPKPIDIGKGRLLPESNIQGMIDELNKTRGTDGYIDPFVYEELLNQWLNNGGTVSKFIKQFPPKNYVNPKATNLPQTIMSRITQPKAIDQQITRESISALYGIPDNSGQTGFLGFGKTNSEKINEIMDIVQQRRDAGQTDKEILKAIQKG